MSSYLSYNETYSKCSCQENSLPVPICCHGTSDKHLREWKCHHNFPEEEQNVYLTADLHIDQ